MSEHKRIVALAVRDTINLPGFAQGIGIKDFESWKSYLELDETVISGLLRYAAEGTKVLLYKMGAVVLIGLDETQEQVILAELESYLQINFLTQMHLFREYDTYLSGEAYTKAEAMARSIRLKWIELQVSDLMEQAEPLLTKIGKGSKRGFAPKICCLIARIQRFQLESIGILAMLGRPYQGSSRESYEKCLEEYCLKERLVVVKEKLDMLTGITETHELFGRFSGWQRLLLLEVLLLICFPIPGLLSLDIGEFLKMIYLWIQAFF